MIHRSVYQITFTERTNIFYQYSFFFNNIEFAVVEKHISLFHLAWLNGCDTYKRALDILKRELWVKFHTNDEEKKGDDNQIYNIKIYGLR